MNRSQLKRHIKSSKLRYLGFLLRKGLVNEKRVPRRQLPEYLRPEVKKRILREAQKKNRYVRVFSLTPKGSKVLRAADLVIKRLSLQ